MDDVEGVCVCVRVRGRAIVLARQAGCGLGPGCQPGLSGPMAALWLIDRRGVRRGGRTDRQVSESFLERSEGRRIGGVMFWKGGDFNVGLRTRDESYVCWIVGPEFPFGSCGRAVVVLKCEVRLL